MRSHDITELTVTQSYPKLLLRTESVAERMLTNWLTFCLHGYIMVSVEGGGEEGEEGEKEGGKGERRGRERVWRGRGGEGRGRSGRTQNTLLLPLSKRGKEISPSWLLLSPPFSFLYSISTILSYHFPPLSGARGAASLPAVQSSEESAGEGTH